jgi:TRAP-type C4-dicarboxylate transport system permease small subunit
MVAPDSGAPESTAKATRRVAGVRAGPLRAWNASLDTATHLLNAIGSVAIFGLMCLMLSDMGSRWLFNKPIAGVAELAGLSIVAIVYLQLGAAVRSGRMTRADFLAAVLAARAPRMALTLNALFQLLGTATMAGLAYVSVGPFVSAWSEGETLGTAGVFLVATWPFRGLLLVGTTLAAICYFSLASAAIGRLFSWRRDRD